jgi:integrase
MKYKELINKWLAIHKYSIKASTYSTYSFIANSHIIDILGDYKVEELNNELIQNYIINKSINGRLDKQGGLSSNTLKDHINLIKLTLKYAIKNSLIQSFDLHFKIPKSDKKNRNLLTINEISILYNYLVTNNTTKNIALMIAISTGIRIGEICALQFSDINFDKNYISITKTCQRINLNDKTTKVIITSPKSESSNRKIPISKEILNLLNTIDYRHDDFIISGKQNAIEPRSFRNHLNLTLKKLNLKKIKFHELRHSFATILIESGADYKSVSDILGHSNINITINLYVHPQIEHNRKTIDLFNSKLKL